MGDVLQPKPQPTGRQEGEDLLSGILGGYLANPTGTGSGPRTAGGQTVGVRGAGGVLVPMNGLPMVGGVGGLPPSLTEYLSQFALPGYGGQLSQGMSGLQQSSLGYGEQALNNFFASGGGWDTISDRLLQEFSADSTRGGPQSVADVYSALDAQRRQGLTRDLGQLEEEFGVAGLSDSSALYESAARRQTESEQNLMAEVARISPDLINSFTARSSNLGQLAGLLAGLPLEVAGAGFNLGEAGRQVGQQNLDRMYQEFIRQQQLFPLLMDFFSNTGERNYSPSTADQLTKLGLLGAGLV